MGSLKTVITRTRIEGLVILLVAAGYIREAYNVPSFFQTPGVPGPTAFPVLLGTVFVLSGLWLLVSPGKPAERSGKKAAARREDEAPGTVSNTGSGFLRRIAGDWHFYTMWAAVLSYLLLMPWMGFPMATFLLLAGFFALLEEKRWPVVIGLALLTTVLIYACFAMGLKVRLPLGLFTPLLK